MISLPVFSATRLLTELVIEIIVGITVLSPALWLAGRVGGQKARFTDAIWIVALGIVAYVLLGGFVHGLLGLAVTFLIWLALIAHFFDTGWATALVIAMVAVIIWLVIAFVLALLGFAILIGLLRGI